MAGPALVEGKAEARVEFVSVGSEHHTTLSVQPVNGKFRAMLHEGKYSVRCKGEQQTVVCLPAGVYHLDLRPGGVTDFEIATIWHKGSEIHLRLTARGEGKHYFSIRSDNLAVEDAQKELRLKHAAVGTLEWTARINSLDSPWVVVAAADDNLENRKELIGTEKVQSAE